MLTVHLWSLVTNLSHNTHRAENTDYPVHINHSSTVKMNIHLAFVCMYTHTTHLEEGFLKSNIKVALASHNHH